VDGGGERCTNFRLGETPRCSTVPQAAIGEVRGERKGEKIRQTLEGEKGCSFDVSSAIRPGGGKDRG